VDPSNFEQLNVDCEIAGQEESIRRQKFTKFIDIVSLKEQSDIQGSPLWVTEVYFR
jgi:hypothetical protein